MILITLLLALIIERIAATAQVWQFSFYYQKYFSLWSKQLGAEKLSSNRLARWLFLLLPTVLIGFVSASIDWILIELAFNTLVLLICIGCIHKRKIYKQFLNAANRGDEQACYLYATQLREYESHPTSVCDDEKNTAQDSCLDSSQDAGSNTEQAIEDSSETRAERIVEQNKEQPTDKVVASSVEKLAEAESESLPDPLAEQALKCDKKGQRLGLTLIWFNFKYYCAVMFWFLCAGPAGAVGYCMMREAFDDKNGLVTLKETVSIKRILHVLDWLPARVCSAGYLLIGDFTRSSGIWLGYLLDFTSPAKNLVCDIAQAAETVELQYDNKILEPVCMLKLAKRNILFFLAMVAVLTLYGGIA